MRAMIQCMHENNYYNLAFPSKEKELQVLCDSLGIANTAKTEIKIGNVHNDERLLALLLEQTVNLDQLNFLMKRLDSFDQKELATFYAAAYAEKAKTMTELINLSFNTHCYGLVADFSDLNGVGRQMYLTEQMAVSAEDLQSFDGQGYFGKVITANTHPAITPYGVVIKNNNEIVQEERARRASLHKPSIARRAKKKKQVQFKICPFGYPCLRRILPPLSQADMVKEWSHYSCMAM